MSFKTVFILCYFQFVFSLGTNLFISTIVDTNTVHIIIISVSFIFSFKDNKDQRLEIRSIIVKVKI